MPEDVVKRAESGFEIKREYTAADVPGDLAARLGAPGEYPFTRHIYPTGNRVRTWQPSLYSGFGEPADANRRIRYLIQQGNGRANIAFDLPTQMGFDSDDPSISDEVGRVGVAIDSLADVETLFDGVPLDRTPVSMNISAVAPVMVAMLAAVAKKQGVALARLQGTIANDIAHEFLSRGAWIYPVDASLRFLGDTAEFVIRRIPQFYAFNIRSCLLHEQAASPPQEIGIAFSVARAYIDTVLERGIAIDEVAPRMSFFLGSGMRFLEEASKYRAARRLWATIVRDQYGSRVEKSQMMRFTAIASSGSHFTAQMPELNLVRGALGALSGALGGAQAMLGTTMDEAYDIPTEHTQLLALRTQQLIALESDVTATVDPLGGSFFVEAMTDKIEECARAMMAEVAASGGLRAGIESGSLQRRIEERAFQVQRELDSGERPKVGANVHREEETADIATWKPDPAVLERRRRALSELRSTRSTTETERALDDLARASADRGSIMPAMIAAVESYATVGEITERLRRVVGVFHEPVTL